MNIINKCEHIFYLQTQTNEIYSRILVPACSSYDKVDDQFLHFHHTESPTYFLIGCLLQPL